MHIITIIFLLAFASSLFIQLWLTLRHIRHITSRRDVVPEAFKQRIKLTEHQLAADYTVTRARFGIIELLFGSILLLSWTLGGGLNYLELLVKNMDLSPIWTGVLVFLALFLIMGILDLPFSLYRTFSIEQRFGFNRSTFTIFLVDLIKQTILLILIGVPLLWVVFWLMETAGSIWWLAVWGVWMGFSLFLMWAYPAFIAPIFNKFVPLENAELKVIIEKLLQRCGFASNGIFIMDGSKRSNHGNAYFTGMGNNKRIVFFDTLLKSLEPNEVEAVLAHELGHFKRKHITKRIISMAIISLLGLALLGWLMQYEPFYAALGVGNPSTYMALILFMLVSPVFTIYLQPVMAYFSRKHEFEADDYAAQQSDAQTLIQALVKLYKENANTLTPDPLYSAFHDSHPPASVRIAHLALKTQG